MASSALWVSVISYIYNSKCAPNPGRSGALCVSAGIDLATIGGLVLRLQASRKAMRITFRVSQSGVVIFNVGSANRCVVDNSRALFVQQYAPFPAARRH